jgi:hypothetical protein
MSDPLLEKIRERIAGYVDDAICRTETNLAPTVDAIMADVETALVLARREAHRTIPHGQTAVERYPLPTRTRWCNQQLERTYDYPDWEIADIPGFNVALMRHALDLHARPYRTEMVQADESDPWGERGQE